MLGLLGGGRVDERLTPGFLNLIANMAGHNSDLTSVIEALQ
jgi:hypothetical protein